MPDSNRTLDSWGLRATNYTTGLFILSNYPLKIFIKTEFVISCMPKKDDSDSYMISELGNWNVAAQFSEEMVMQPLKRCNNYEDIARFGHHSLLDELENIDEISIDVLKIKGFSRMLNELIKVCRNNKFAMKRGKTKEDLTEIEEKLINIRTILSKCYEEIPNKITKTTEIVLKTQVFNLLLEKVCKLREDLHDPLNKNNLIFVDKEQVDMSALKKSIFTEATTLG